LQIICGSCIEGREEGKKEVNYWACATYEHRRSREHPMQRAMYIFVEDLTPVTMPTVAEGSQLDSCMGSPGYNVAIEASYKVKHVPLSPSPAAISGSNGTSPLSPLSVRLVMVW
jgi:hypothetical protein